MFSRTGVLFAAGALILTAVNIVTLTANLSIQANAAVGGKDRHALWQDTDFRQAVEDVVERCKISSDKIKC